MIRLFGVLSTGGVPVHFKSTGGAEEMVLGPLIEASRSLSQMMGSGEVRRLAFKKDTMLLAECEKGYIVVALVTGAEDYMESLLQMVSEAIDESDMPEADGVVTAAHRSIAANIIDRYVVDPPNASFSETIAAIWRPVLSAIRSDPHLNGIEARLNRMLMGSSPTIDWDWFKMSVPTSAESALGHALSGAFDFACAASMDSAEPSALLLAIKCGILAHSMSKCFAPPLAELERLVSMVPESDELFPLANALVGLATKKAIPADYARAFRDAALSFHMEDDDEHLMRGFLFVDPRIIDYKLAEELLKHYKGRSVVVCALIEALTERNSIFEKLYSITSYDAYRGELAVQKSRIRSVLASVEKVVVPEIASELSEGRGYDIGITASLRLQNYIAVLTALSESPVLSLSERKEVLEEVLSLYRSYFRRLMEVRIPLFSYTLDSVFQSMSVAIAEYYTLLAGEERKRYIEHSVQPFLSDVVRTVRNERHKSRIKLSLLVVANALLPVLSRARTLADEEVELILIAMKTLDMDTLDAQQITRPIEYATEMGNALNSINAVASMVLSGQELIDTLKTGVRTAVLNLQWFVANGIVCRDDIVSVTASLSVIADALSDSELEDLVDRTLSVNSVATQAMTQSESELAMMASPLIELLLIASERTGRAKFRSLAETVYGSAIEAWSKYGFPEIEESFKRKFGGLLGKSSHSSL